MKKNKIAAPEPEKRIKIVPLSAASFICGAAVMVLEMTGSRVIAPYMGTSLIVWTSIIGIIMASLSAGYWLGGIVSDKKPEASLLAKIILAAAVTVALMSLASNAILSGILSNIRNIYVASVFASLALFTVPSVLLGMVSPFIVRLAMDNLGSAGTTVGRFSALSSTGSILGTFLGGFVLISVMSSGVILFVVAAALALVAALVLGSVRRPVKTSAAATVIFLALAGIAQAYGLPMAPEGIHLDSPYNHILVADSREFLTGRPTRLLQTDPHGAQSLMYRDAPNELVSDYTKFYDLAFHYRPDARRVLMLGGGGYCVPKHLVATRPGVSLDVVELDPGITQAARDYFGFKDSPEVAIHHEDARIFLNRGANDPAYAGTYDAVFEDVFGSWYSIPFHLTTVECMKRVSDLLKPDGVLVINVISSMYGDKSGSLQGIYASVAKNFPVVKLFPASYKEGREAVQNVMIVAFKSKDTARERAPQTPEMARLLSYEWKEKYVTTVPAFTDAFAPVEKYSLRY